MKNKSSIISLQRLFSFEKSTNRAFKFAQSTKNHPTSILPCEIFKIVRLINIRTTHSPPETSKNNKIKKKEGKKRVELKFGPSPESRRRTGAHLGSPPVLPYANKIKANRDNFEISIHSPRARANFNHRSIAH